MKKYIIAVMIYDRRTDDIIGDDAHTFTCLSQAQEYYYETIGRYICGFKLAKVDIDTNTKFDFPKLCVIRDEVTSIGIALSEMDN